MPELVPLLFAVLVLGAAAFVQSATGFGMALVAMAGLPLVMGVNDAVTLVATFNLAVTTNIMWWNRSGLSWKRARGLVLAVLIGIPIGYFVFKSMESAWLIRILGVILIVVSLNDLRFSKRGPGEVNFSLPGWSAFPIGIGGGILGGAFNVGGPPVVAFVYSQNWTKAQSVAVLQSCFLAGGISRNTLMAINGDYSQKLFITCAWALVPAIVAIWLGKRTLDRLPSELLRRLVFIFVLAMGIKYLIWP